MERYKEYYDEQKESERDRHRIIPLIYEILKHGCMLIVSKDNREKGQVDQWMSGSLLQRTGNALREEKVRICQR